MSAGHTPGPWQWIVEDDRGHKHTSIHTAWNHSQLGGPAPVVTTGTGPAMNEKREFVHPVEAVTTIHIRDEDAKLIAAAPSLADALEARRGEHPKCSKTGGRDTRCLFCKQADAALALAGRL